MNLVGVSSDLIPFGISSFRDWAWDAFPTRSVVYVFGNISSLVNVIDKHPHLHGCLKFFHRWVLGKEEVGINQGPVYANI